MQNDRVIMAPFVVPVERGLWVVDMKVKIYLGYSISSYTHDEKKIHVHIMHQLVGYFAWRKMFFSGSFILRLFLH